MTAELKEKTENKAERRPEKASPATIERAESRPRYASPSDIFERDDGLVLLLDMPGVAQKNVEVKLEDRLLSVSGGVEPEEVGDRKSLLEEYVVGDYHRSFTVNEEVDTAGITAELHNGVLKVFLPKAEAARPRKIPVTTV